MRPPSKTIIQVLSFTFILVATATIALISTCNAAEGPTYELTINDHNPPQSTVAKAWDEWKAWVEEKSEGKLKINLIHGGALLKHTEVFKGVQANIAHGGHYVVDKEDGFLLNTVTTLPFLGLLDQRRSGEIFKQLLSEFPAMRAEWKGVKVLGIMMMPPVHIHTVKKPVRLPADIKGMRILGSVEVMLEAIKAAGGTPVEVDIGDMYTAVERGMVEGVINHFPVLNIFRVLELLKFHTVFGEGGISMTPMAFIINERTYNRLPQHIQAILAESGRVWEEKQLKWDAVSKNLAMDNVKKWGHTLVPLGSKEISEWQQTCSKIYEQWIRQCQDRGLPGEEVLKKIRRLISSGY